MNTQKPTTRRFFLNFFRLYESKQHRKRQSFILLLESLAPSRDKCTMPISTLRLIFFSIASASFIYFIFNEQSNKGN